MSKMDRSRLLNLPKEIRLVILDHVVDDKAPVVVGRPSSMPWHGKPASYHPSIINVCRLMRREALPLFYRGRRVVLLLRFREGRAQVQRWIETELSIPAVCKNIEDVSIQLFESPHRTTAILLNCKTLSVINRDSFVHPLTGQDLRILRDIDGLLCDTKSRNCDRPRALKDVVRQLIEMITAAIEDSRVMRRECMANLQLQGYTDFQLRFEVISMLYHGCED
jgi:hypothetical protein